MLQCQKHLFSLPDEIHYLNCAYMSPMLNSVEAAAQIGLTKEKNPTLIQARDFFQTQEEVRDVFAELIKASAESIILCPSVSYGMASVFNNIPPKEGGNAVTVEGEFPSGYFALENWAKLAQNQLRIAGYGTKSDRGSSIQEDLLSKIDERTSVVLVSSVHWMNGLKFDLDTIGAKCKEVGAYFIVDGSQSVGAVPIDVQKSKIDALITTGYKWLFGPYSTSLAYVGPRFNEGDPIENSWMNREEAENFARLADYNPNYTIGAGRFNVGETGNLILMPMLLRALRQVREWGVENIINYCDILSRPLIRFFDQNDITYERSDCFSPHLFDLQLPFEADAEQLKTVFKENKIMVSVRGTAVRLSFNVFNDTTDVEALISVLQEIVHKGAELTIKNH